MATWAANWGQLGFLGLILRSPAAAMGSDSKDRDHGRNPAGHPIGTFHQLGMIFPVRLAETPLRI